MPTMLDAVEAVRQMEEATNEKKREVGALLRTQRLSLGLRLKDVGKKIKRTPATVHNTEYGRFTIKTAAKVAKLYDRLVA